MSRIHQPEVAFVERIANGDIDTFTQLYDAYACNLYALALRIVGDPACAEDIVLKAFVDVWCNPSHYLSDDVSIYTLLLRKTHTLSVSPGMPSTA